jgi:hypothetical protein
MRALVADGRGGVAIQDVEEVVAGPNEVVMAVRGHVAQPR